LVEPSVATRATIPTDLKSLEAALAQPEACYKRVPPHHSLCESDDHPVRPRKY
jgi:hypothetical protein